MARSSQQAVTKLTAAGQPRSDPYKQRYGLFSYPGTLAAGEDSYKRSQPVRRNPEETKARNFYTVQPKKGQLNEAYFSAPQFVSVGDKYVEKAPLYRKEFESVQAMRQTHAAGWKGGAKTQPNVFSTFAYQVDPIRECPCYKLPDGTVQQGPKNFYTAAGKRGAAGSTPNTLFSRHPEYVLDPYERKDQHLRGQRINERQQRLEAPFRTTDYGAKNFTSNKQTFGLDREMEDRSRTQSQPGLKHEKPFLPTNPAKEQSTIGKYPQHVADPFPEKTFDQRSGGVWRPVHNYKSVPAPSVVNHIRNMMTAHPGARNGIRY